MTELTSLNRRRGAIKSQLTKINKFIAEEIDKSDEIDLSNKLEILCKLENKLEDLQIDYYNVLKEDEVETHEKELDTISEDIQKQKVSLKRFLTSNKIQSSDLSHDNSYNSKKLNIKLPEIPLPKFDGSYENWNNFKTQFNSIIDSNELLSNEQKLFYLQSSLIGNAKKIESIDDSYESLLNALKNRYENKRLIVNSHLKSLLMLEKIGYETADKLRILVDNILKHVRALKVMGIEMNNFGENLLINIILEKLDRVTCKEYEMSLTTSELPIWDNFISFLQNRCRILENTQEISRQVKPKFTQNKVRNFVLKSNNVLCCLCRKQHELYNCDSFLKMTPLERFNIVKKNNLCINCLSCTHKLSLCRSKYTCRYCLNKHNYMLCRNQNAMQELKSSKPNLESNTTPTETERNSENNKSNKVEHCAIAQNLTSCFLSERKNIILATAIIYVKNSEGCLYKARSIIDSGSQINAISSRFANILGLKQHRMNMSIHSIGGNLISVKKEVCAEISNFNNSFSEAMNFFVIPKITDIMPAEKINISQFSFPENISFADPTFYKPGKIDLLIGAEQFFNIIKNDTIKITDSLILKETVFGYIVSGAIKDKTKINYCGFISQLDELEENVKRFWETENLEDSPSLRDVEIECENHFCKTHRRDVKTGKYIVSLPIKEELELGDSYSLAKSRLEGLWKRLDKNIEMKNLYVQFMHEYLHLNHMKEIKFSENVKYILPHHGVYRADSNTTKLRVVFNASAPTSTGVSLNDCLLKGGTVQEELFSILLRFRKHKIAFVADIQKMYRQILVDPNQCNLQCILWKNNPLEEIKIFQLLTVTYGTSCAPFLATRTVKQLAMDEENNYPLASAAAHTDIYVDDILTGADNLNIALHLQHQLIEMFRNAGMELHKWCSNNKTLLDQVPLQQKEYDFDETKNNSVKTLGLRWDPKEDNFYFNVSSCADTPTKRSVLSEISRLYDPLGLLGPVITQAKIYLQTLWKLNLEWNQEIPIAEKNKWENFRKKLLEIKFIYIPRFVFTDCVDKVEIHGFSDAAKEAYGAVVYLRCITSRGEIKVSLLCSKSRISPMKEVTIPRLELCGAVLLARLVKKVTDSLKTDINEVFWWTDSKIVLAWVVKPLSSLKLFVKNRVRIIQNLTKLNSWSHVNSKENPADLISRGVDADKLKNCALWWHGPSFLHQNFEIKPYSVTSIENSDFYMKELKESPEVLSTFVQKSDTLDIINNCSSFTKLRRIIAWCLRFIENVRNPLHQTVGCLSRDELANALTCIVKIVQTTAFPEEIQCLKKGRPISNVSNLLTLCPFIDSQGVIRVGGRLKNSNLNPECKHPILLPNNHNFTYIVINYFHVLYFHVGPEGTLSFIRTKFWIVKARNIVRKILKNCIRCLKISARPSQQVMADLPSIRVNPCKVFSNVGVDFTGAFTVKPFAGRVRKFHKCYVCIFICLVVKAIHLEVVYNLTTESFLAALKRFIARRNKPVEIFSDNGTNFVGANNELRKILKELFKRSSKDKIEDFIANEGIKWNFNPPLAPHFGGLWEAGVKSLKHHLKRVIGKTVLSYEEFLALVTQVEAILNSRPLCPLSNDPNDISALTPAHFLVGSSLEALPEHDLSDTSMNRLNRWQLVQKFTQTLWKKWTNEYLNRLQQRPKWCKGPIKFKEGDIILVKNNEYSGYLKWNLARIVKLHPGKDNIVRVVTIKDKNGIHKRAVSSIAALPFVN